MSDDPSSQALAGRFQKGVDDPRRWRKGTAPKEIVAFREDLIARLPRALVILDELLGSGDDRIRLAAVVEIMDRTLGKPKLVDSDTEQAVRAELKAAFDKVRERLDPATYAKVVEVLADKP